MRLSDGEELERAKKRSQARGPQGNARPKLERGTPSKRSSGHRSNHVKCGESGGSTNAHAMPLDKVEERQPHAAPTSYPTAQASILRQSPPLGSLHLYPNRFSLRLCRLLHHRLAVLVPLLSVIEFPRQPELVETNPPQPRAPPLQLCVARLRYQSHNSPFQDWLPARAARQVEVGGGAVRDAQDEDRLHGIEMETPRHVLERDNQRGGARFPLPISVTLRVALIGRTPPCCCNGSRPFRGRIDVQPVGHFLRQV
mmetsp:Transcript_28666/g.64911  ORF Transcript_28666/g.64911 Transcript_28666/m.64911 type:complete len:255 (+) Transcript_28666:854-1618(+)